MCIAIPMQVSEVDGFNAQCTAKGVERLVSLWQLQEEAVLPGDWVMVHVDQAIRKVSAEEARACWELFDQMLAGEALTS
jgi:hydrogenase expression/formation protein HypC